MQTLNPLIVGQIGSGKTQFAKRLLSISPRAVVLDPSDDYEDGPIYTDFREAVEFFKKNLHSDYHLIYRFDPDNTAAFNAWLDLVFRSQRYLDLPPIALFLEESSYFSGARGELNHYLSRVYTKGRKPKINIVTVVQRDTQINTIIRAQSHVWISLKQYKLSTDMKETFTKSQLDTIPNLEPLKPGMVAREGKHYVSAPPNFDIFGVWKRRLTRE